MNFLRNTWYCAGWSEEIKDRPLARTLLNEPVMFFRTTDGTIAALADRCPHRFAPLHLGVFDGEHIECPYHGLKFGADGACVHNPHGNGVIPQAAFVKRYPVTERYGAIWIWMGDVRRADPSKIVDLSEVQPRPGWSVIRSYLRLQVHYELVTDNLMDLSHVRFLHPFLTFKGDPPVGFREERSLKQDGDAIWAMNQRFSQPVTPLFQMLWEGQAPPVATMRANMRWNAPAVLYLDCGMSPEGCDIADGPSALTAHILTPETDSSTHYFWAQARDGLVGRADADQQMRETIDNIFTNEDASMIAACQQRMGTSDLFSLKPVLLPGDAPAVRVRRVLQDLIDREIGDSACTDAKNDSTAAAQKIDHHTVQAGSRSH